jgi:hypothetical protein
MKVAVAAASVGVSIGTDGGVSVGVSTETDGSVLVGVTVLTRLAILTGWAILAGGRVAGGSCLAAQAMIEKRVSVRMRAMRRNLECRGTWCDITGGCRAQRGPPMLALARRPLRYTPGIVDLRTWPGRADSHDGTWDVPHQGCDHMGDSLHLNDRSGRDLSMNLSLSTSPQKEREPNQGGSGESQGEPD